MSTIKENTIPLILNGCKYWLYPITSHLTVWEAPANQPQAVLLYDDDAEEVVVSWTVPLKAVGYRKWSASYGENMFPNNGEQNDSSWLVCLKHVHFFRPCVII